jgi:hypothetical protein
MIDLEQLAKLNRLYVKDNLIFVQPIDEYNYITYPINDLTKCLRVTLEQYLGLRANYYKFNEKLTQLVVRE